MIVRELITKLGFQINVAELQRYQRALAGLGKQRTGADARALTAQKRITDELRKQKAIVAGTRPVQPAPRPQPHAPGGAGGGGEGGGLLVGAKRAMMAVGAYVGVREIGRTVDEYIGASARLKEAAEITGESFETVEKRAFDAAIVTRSSFQATTAFMTKTARSISKFGGSFEDAAKITETLNAGLVVGGASATEAASATLQLGQAMGSGTLQGQEMNAILEASDVLAAALAETMGYDTPAAMKKAGSEGKIQSEKLAKALLSMNEDMMRRLLKMPLTFGQAFEIAATRAKRALGKIEKDTTIFTTMAVAIDKTFAALENGVDIINKVFGNFGHFLTQIAYWIGVVFAVKGYRALLLAAKGANIFLFSLKSIGRFIATMSRRIPWLLAFEALYLVAQDIYYWLTGGKSLIGRWLGDPKPFIDAFNKIKDALGSFDTTKLLSDWKAVAEVFKTIADYCKAIGDFLARHAIKLGMGTDQMREAVREAELKDRNPNMSDAEIQRQVKAQTVYQDQPRVTAAQLAAQPYGGPGALADNRTQNVTVNVPAGTTPQQAGKVAVETAAGMATQTGYGLGRLGAVK